MGAAEQRRLEELGLGRPLDDRRAGPEMGPATGPEVCSDPAVIWSVTQLWLCLTTPRTFLPASRSS